ncbi:MAG: TonB-dependent receptor plug domain-containing protein [Muribaculaceae bacterium]|nr:TonB-dependent receptor plug domain-containing protein [Muribaculaceae bacterium]
MIRRFASFMLAVAAVLTAMASEPFIGTLRNTRGKPVKGVKVFLHTPKDAVKSNKNGEFKFEDVAPDDSIRVVYKKKIHSFAVNDRKDVMLVVGEDGRIFDKDNYIGETFHGHLVDYKGKPIRGAMVYASDPFDYVKSDRDGKFLIDNVVETDTLHIKHDGYIHDIAMDGSKGMYIKILRNTGRRVDSELINTGAGLVDARYYNGPRSVITAEELEKTGTQDLLEAMKMMRSVTIGETEDGERFLSLRLGASPLWIVDGVRMSRMPDITVMEVKKIEILYDGSMYGVGAWGGVVNITTKGSNF